jgi:hypothetical protein
LGVEAPVAAGGQPASIEVADFDGDGHLDVAVANFSGHTVGVFAGDGAGGLAPMVSYPVGASMAEPAPRWLVAADLDDDGAIDLAVANAGPQDPADDTVSILWNEGLGAFSPAVDLAVDDNPRGMTVASSCPATVTAGTRAPWCGSCSATACAASPRCPR